MVTIKYKKRNYRFLFTINAWFICCDEYNCELYELENIEDNERSIANNIIYGAYVNYCLVNRNPILLSKEKLFRIIDKIRVEDYKRLEEGMLSAKLMGRTVGQITTEETEKKKEK